jgi:hypothetical protein
MDEADNLSFVFQEPLKVGVIVTEIEHTKIPLNQTFYKQIN